jgi:hypothetical protein
MDHDQVTSRLRRLGEEPVPGDVADAHLSAIARVRPQRRLGRAGLVAAAAVAVLALAAIPTGLLGSSDGDRTDLAADVREAEAANQAAARPEGRGRPGWAGPPEGRGACVGPPPWAGSPPEGETEAERDAARAAQVEAWRAQRAAEGCPTDDEQDD